MADGVATILKIVNFQVYEGLLPCLIPVRSLAGTISLISLSLAAYFTRETFSICPSRIHGFDYFYRIFILFQITLGVKVFLMVNAEFPTIAMYLAIAPLAAVVAAVPLRACNNAYVFLRPSPRHGT